MTVYSPVPGRIKQDVISEVIDGEVVAIDLGTGVYYNLRGSAVLCWDLMNRGLTNDEIVESIVANYDVSPSDGARCVADLVSQVTDFGLLGSSDSVERSDGDDSETSIRPKGPFEPATIDRYDEMAYVLALDPIHEVDQEVGWPKQG